MSLLTLRESCKSDTNAFVKSVILSFPSSIHMFTKMVKLIISIESMRGYVKYGLFVHKTIISYIQPTLQTMPADFQAASPV